MPGACADARASKPGNNESEESFSPAKAMQRFKGGIFLVPEHDDLTFPVPFPQQTCPLPQVLDPAG